MPSGVYKRTEEYKKKISEIRKGYKQTKQHRLNSRVPRKGSGIYVRTKENLENIKKSCTFKHLALKGMPKEKHPRWIKDRSLLKVSEKKHLDVKYKYWMLEVRKRDNWKCRIINKDCKGRLESHHILNWIGYPELRYEINNGITLCHAHHPRGRAKEKRMVSTFMELLSVSKE